MKKQQPDKPIDEELLMRMMAGETTKPEENSSTSETEQTEEPRTGKIETAVPVEKVQDGKRCSPL